jgi:hypothetical protein
MRRTIFLLLTGAALVLATPSQARADITGFLGTSPTPSARGLRGVGFGINILVIGFELEYAHTSEDPVENAPSVRTGMINGLVQTPTSRTQFYLTAGGGFYRETLDDDSVTNVGTNIGGGVKVGLVGPLRLRLDYRVFSLRGSPRYKNPHRFYAGANVSF